MNERIDELALQAKTSMPQNTLDVNDWIEAYNKKFAELIVEDIINVLDSDNTIRHIAYTTFDLSIVESAVEKSINAITEHYGMKKHIRTNNERTMGRKVSSL